MPDTYCTPEMTGIMGDFDRLLTGVHMVYEVHLNSPVNGAVLASWYVPVKNKDVKGELKRMVEEAHRMGYREALEDARLWVSTVRH